jgi:hypothetical protein
MCPGVQSAPRPKKFDYQAIIKNTKVTGVRCAGLLESCKIPGDFGQEDQEDQEDQGPVTRL